VQSAAPAEAQISRMPMPLIKVRVKSFLKIPDRE
jgi:hypothetical protein